MKDNRVDHLRRLFQFAEGLKGCSDRGAPLTDAEKIALMVLVRGAVYDTLIIMRDSLETK